jgi:glycosyltransferase involved in cell wall biosynthesis
MGTQTKICFVSLPARGAFIPGAAGRVGGAEVQVRHLTTYIAAQAGFEAHVIVEDSGQAEREVVDGVNLWRLDQPKERASAMGGAWRKIGSAASLWRRIRSLRADAYVQFSAGAETGIAEHAAHSVGAAFVYMIASDSECKPPWSRGGGIIPRLFRRGLARADAVIAQHSAQQEAARQALGRETVVVPSVFPFLPFEPSSGTLVLWAGRCSSPKRPDLALQLARALPGVHFLIAAPPSDHEEALFERIRTEAGACPNVEFLPGVAHREIAGLYRRAAILLNTSDYEGVPNTFLEAAAYGLAIVSLNADPDGVLTKEGAGICAEGDFGRFEHVVRHLSADATRRIELARRGREILASRHDINNVGPLFLDLVRKSLLQIGRAHV